jgi:uncharacterized repeat protein (TIGR01451 family)
MFRKIVSNLSFSPALVGQLSFYAKRLKKEEMTRKLGLIFVVLALIVQSLAVFQAPESANAASNNDFVSGGIGNSLNNFISPYDANNNNLKDILNYFGITREELSAAQYTSWAPKDVLSWGFQPKFSYAQGERQVDVTDANHNVVTTVYGRPNNLFNTAPNAKIYGWAGYSSKIGWFAIMQACGNLVTKVIPPAPPAPTAECTKLSGTIISRTRFSLTAAASGGNGATISKYSFIVKDSAGKAVFSNAIATSATSVNSGEFTLDNIGSYNASVSVSTSVGEKTSSNCATTITVAPPAKCAVNSNLTVESPECQPCPGNDTVWIKDKTCSAVIVKTKTAQNTTQSSADASKVTAQAGDQILYTISAENTGLVPATVELKENLQDVLEYSTLVDNGGGKYNATDKTLTWPSITLGKGEQQKRVFAIRILNTIPGTAQGQSEPTSYDCVLTNTFGNQVDVKVQCPTEKVVEQVANQLPKTGPSENILFAGIVLSIATYFYARTRQVKKEVRLIRHSLSSGTI